MAKLTSKNSLERDTLEGDSPVCEVDMLFLKRVGLLGLEA